MRYVVDIRDDLYVLFGYSSPDGSPDNSPVGEKTVLLVRSSSHADDGSNVISMSEEGTPRCS